MAVTPIKVPLEFSVMRLVFAALGLAGLSLMLAVSAYQLGLKGGMTIVVSALLAVAVALLIFGGCFYFSQPYLKRSVPIPRGVGFVLPVIFLLAITLLTSTGCGTPKPVKSHAVVMLDVSRSVKATDEELAAAALTISKAHSIPVFDSDFNVLRTRTHRSVVMGSPESGPQSRKNVLGLFGSVGSEGLVRLIQ
ncbi:MAG: hypothetical protein ACRD44_06470 [Bryobacteraceae bacterium]